MITPILLNRLAWKGYLVFMCTNFAFVPLVYFCYPETANLTLEEIDYIFSDDSKNSVKWSLEMRKERMKGGRRESFVPTGAGSRRASRASKPGIEHDGERTLRSSRDETYGKEDSYEHSEKV